MTLLSSYSSRSLSRFGDHQENVQAHLRHLIHRHLKASAQGSSFIILQQAIDRLRNLLSNIAIYKISPKFIELVLNFTYGLLPIILFAPLVLEQKISIGDYVALNTASLYIMNACGVLVQHQLALIDYQIAYRRIHTLYQV
jgi:ABC-type uncharacterized transport system fused permease/ATPase subunit